MSNVISNKDNSTTKTTNSAVAGELSMPYVDTRHVTISLVHNYSNYRKVNIKVLGHRKEVIGSSYRSSTVLSSCKEIEKYFPAIVGVSSNNVDFLSKVKAWLSNIQFNVNNNDATLNTSFAYDTKQAYLDIKAKETKIEEEYDKADKSNITALKAALTKKVNAIHELESTKYLVGSPINVVEYIIYRHCLLYNDVAKDSALINSDPNIRFYIKDSVKEEAKKKAIINAKSKAMANFLEVNKTPSKFDDVYVVICSYKNDNLIIALNKSIEEKQDVLMTFVNENPVKFNNIITDEHLHTKAFIEVLIAKGELVRSEYNQQISTVTGTFIGANLNEAVTYFDNPANVATRNTFENLLKNNK